MMNDRDQTSRVARVAFYTFPHFPPQFSFIYELRIIAIMLTKYLKKIRFYIIKNKRPGN